MSVGGHSSLARRRRRGLLGAATGILPGLVLTGTVGPVGIAVGLVGGGVFSLCVEPDRGPVATGIMGASLAIPAWLLIELTTLPLVTTGSPQWTLATVRASLPDLGVWLVAGTALGTIWSPLAWMTGSGQSSEAPPDDTGADDPTRIVVLGGGFVGLYAARRLEQLFGPDPSITVQLVSRHNATLFTPMLAEVAGGSVSPTHITTPLRTALRRTQVIEGSVEAIHPDQQEIVVNPGSSPTAASPIQGAKSTGDGAHERLPYDHIVLGLGAVPDPKGIDSDRAFVHDFKRLADAIEIRNHVVECFERADVTDDPAERDQLTTFVVAGGGFGGVELAGAVNDLVHGLLPYYPDVHASDIEVVVVHSRDRILPEIGEELADYALKQLRARGVQFELETRVSAASHGTVELSDGRRLAAETLVWTAGNRPHPLLETADLPGETSGAVAVDETLSVPDREGVWAAGDCAAVHDAETGERHPNTAQHAIRAATAAAENVHAVVTGGSPKPFSYRSQGTLAVIGHQVAVAEVMGRQFSGRLAWLFWRAVYLAKLPGLAQKARVAVDWVAELFFPRTLARTEGRVQRPIGASGAESHRPDPDRCESSASAEREKLDSDGGAPTDGRSEADS